MGRDIAGMRSRTLAALPRDRGRPLPPLTAETRWLGVVGAALLATLVLDLWIVQQRLLPSLYAVPLLLAAHHLSRLVVVVVGLLAVVAHLIALQTVAEPAAAWGLDLLAIGAILWAAFWVAAQREELARRAADEQAAASERERERLSQLAVVAHELRNPLTALNGFTQMLRRRGEYDVDLVATISRQGRRVGRLARDLSELAVPDGAAVTLESCEIDLRDVAREVVEDARLAAERHRLRLVAPPEPLIGQWDRERLEQVLDNLVSNAIKYSPDGGDVVVRLAPVGEWIRIAVSDAGIGIAPADVPFVFERFYRSQQAPHGRGLGLGLHVVRRLVEAHGGHVSVSSTVGRGTSFIVMLPRGLPGVHTDTRRRPTTAADPRLRVVQRSSSEPEEAVRRGTPGASGMLPG